MEMKTHSNTTQSSSYDAMSIYDRPLSKKHKILTIFLFVLWILM